ncbi:cupin domain-containing protein [Grimontia hollisae]|uniref:Anti-sigma factor, putative, ChrR family n=1 Tax=Grimontia hollisae TaxID=673 RepID=A0A377J6Z4_GRIHO|nr:cupin domain-containing protein [Grimontia hollisae]MDF2184941.1 cupin domain-containing protein [Grimontia hollisae]STO98089.1 anti-sigma factor, putative, ChrR family [Grimontia hollisae]STQ76096.1 anti-sigma factor, putative, ChrR family [Grimontia hollisae]
MLNMQFNKRVIINTCDMDWQPSRVEGVYRKPLSREEAERGHATSIVKYSPKSRFISHEHPLGEEILVLEGVFSDETGDYPAGSYIRNPPGFTHSPFSEVGCIILVKLHQFSANDHHMVRINTRSEEGWIDGQGRLKMLPLHEFNGEQVALIKWPAGQHFFSISHFCGEEVYVLEGEYRDEYGRYRAGTWIRNPHMFEYNPYAEEDTLLWVKVGHLPYPGSAK